MSGRDLSLYLAVVLVFFMVVNMIQGMDRQDDPSYSQIRTYFEQERVKRFQLKDDTLTLELRGEGDAVSTVTCRVNVSTSPASSTHSTVISTTLAAFRLPAAFVTVV